MELPGCFVFFETGRCFENAFDWTTMVMSRRRCWCRWRCCLICGHSFVSLDKIQRSKKSHTHARFEYWTIDAKWFNETWCFQPKKNKRAMWHMQTRSIEKTTLIFGFITNTSTIDCSSISLAETKLFGHFSHSRLSFPSVSFHMLLQKISLISNA